MLKCILLSTLVTNIRRVPRAGAGTGALIYSLILPMFVEDLLYIWNFVSGDTKTSANGIAFQGFMI